jgi:site-specific DNA-methyltransferase (adenine-specific)
VAGTALDVPKARPMLKTPARNTLYYGDNLAILRDHVEDESIDLVYLDPPFNSNANYNLLFKAPDGHQSRAQIEAFDDTWHWNEPAEQAFDEVMQSGNSDAAEMLRAMRSFLKENDMMAYLAMMAVRLIELHRVLKPTGSLYLHCDPTASHYLKILLDAVFGPTKVGNELIWKRQNAKGLAFTRFARNHDVILRYTKTDVWIWNAQYVGHDPSYLSQFYRYKDADGRVYRLADLTNPNKNRPNLTYDFLGVTRVWRWTQQRMQKAFEDGLIVQNRPGGVPALKRFLDEQEGNPIDDVWTDIQAVQAQAHERLGYPTQKPLALLERIVSSSSNEGDLVLDPFCGCGTTVHAAQKLSRRWIGIDVTHLAIHLIQRRLKDAFPGLQFDIAGVPKDLDGARALAIQDRRIPKMGARDDRRPTIQRREKRRRRRRGRFSLYKTRRQEDRKGHRLGQGRPEPQSRDGEGSHRHGGSRGRQDGRVFDAGAGDKGHGHASRSRWLLHDRLRAIPKDPDRYRRTAFRPKQPAAFALAGHVGL